MWECGKNLQCVAVALFYSIYVGDESVRLFNLHVHVRVDVVFRSTRVEEYCTEKGPGKLPAWTVLTCISSLRDGFQ